MTRVLGTTGRKGGSGIAGVRRSATTSRQQPDSRTPVAGSLFGNGMSASYGAQMGGSGQYNTMQLPSTLEVDIENIYASNRYLPKNPFQQNALFRQIYRYDVSAGAVVELYSTMPWSEIELTGIKDRTIRQAYEDSFDNLKLVERLPWLTVDYLTLGKMCVHCLFDENKGVWSDMIQHNPDYIHVTPIPIINTDPILNFQAPQALRTLASQLITAGYSPGDKNLLNVLKQVAGTRSIQLNGDNTFYIPRRSGADDYYGTSIYTRILGLVLLESALTNANLLNAYRRSGPIRTITPAGEDDMYAPEELDSLALMFMEADEDPAGSTIVLKTPVTIETLDNVNSSQWRAFDDWPTIQTAKLNALGFSESMLNGEASYGTTEINLSVFIQRVEALQSQITKDLIVNKICLNLAKAMDFRYTNKRGNSKNSDYVLPTIKWSKSLSPVGNADVLEALDRAKAFGVPITLRTYSSATGVDFQSEMDSQQQDAKDREEIKKYTGATPGEDADVNASTEDLKKILMNNPGAARTGGDQSYLNEFQGKITPFNFKLITPSQISSGIKAIKSGQDAAEVLPTFVHSAFQLFLKVAGMPHKGLSAPEIEKLEVEIQKLEKTDPELAAMLEKGLDGLNTDADIEELREQVQPTSHTEDTLDVDRKDMQTEVSEDGTTRTSEPDPVGKDMGEKLRTNQDAMSVPAVDPLEFAENHDPNVKQSNSEINKRITELLKKNEKQAEQKPTPQGHKFEDQIEEEEKNLDDLLQKGGQKPASGTPRKHKVLAAKNMILGHSDPNLVAGLSKCLLRLESAEKRSLNPYVQGTL